MPGSGGGHLVMEKLQPGFAIWLTGLPSSGKTVLAHVLRCLLSYRGIEAQVLDSDELWQKLVPNPTYTNEEQAGFYDELILMAGSLTDEGINVFIAATGQQRVYRQVARSRIACFAEVYVDCLPEVCRSRDTKGFWRRADSGRSLRCRGWEFRMNHPNLPRPSGHKASLGSGCCAPDPPPIG